MFLKAVQTATDRQVAMVKQHQRIRYSYTVNSSQKSLVYFFLVQVMFRLRWAHVDELLTSVSFVQ